MLDLKEYLGFVEKEAAARTIRREPGIERTKEQHEAMFVVLNKISAGTDGVSLEDLRLANRFSGDFVFSSLGNEKKELSEESKAALDLLMD